MFTLVMGAYIEGIRIAQLPLFFMAFTNLFLHSSDKTADITLVALGGAISLALVIVFGEGTYDQLKTTGPFQVGFTEFHTQELSNECAVYYPVHRLRDEDGTTHDPLEFREEIHFMKHGEESLNAMVDIVNWIHPSMFVYPFLKALTFLTIPIFKNGPLAAEFLKQKNVVDAKNAPKSKKSKAAASQKRL